MKAAVLGVILALAARPSTGVVPALVAQQVADTAFRPPIHRPTYPIGTGPVVLIDEAHSNFHTATGRYLPFAELRRRDGYVVRASTGRFTAEALQAGTVLVIANAVSGRQNAPEAPPLSAFTAEEVAAVRDWVTGGGSLLLIADHPPWPAAADDLAKAFGVRFRNGVAADPNIRSGRLVFRRSDGTLVDHPVTRSIDSVATFSGSSFQVDAAGQPLLLFGAGVYSYAQQNDPNPLPLEGHLQGALLLVGRGRVAVFGEAAMFSAQLSGPDMHPMGMNAPIAQQNPYFLLSMMHWLTAAM